MTTYNQSHRILLFVLAGWSLIPSTQTNDDIISGRVVTPTTSGEEMEMGTVMDAEHGAATVEGSSYLEVYSIDGFSTEIVTLFDPMTTGGDDRIGPKPSWRWLPFKWNWIVIFRLISAIIGFFGNLLVMAVLFQRRGACRSTDTLVGALAAADFVTSVALLIQIPKAVKVPDTLLGSLYCRFIPQSVPLFLGIYASTYTLTAISVERCVAVARPIFFQRFLTRRFVNTVIVAIWILSLLFLSLTVIAWKGVDESTDRCAITLGSAELETSVSTFSALFKLFIPAITLVTTQIVIVVKLEKQSKSIKTSGSTTTTYHQTVKVRVIKLMLAVIITYLALWTPAHICLFLTATGILPRAFRQGLIFQVLTVVGFYNSCINPFIYVLRHDEFRDAVKKFFKGAGNIKVPIFESRENNRAHLKSASASA